MDDIKLIVSKNYKLGNKRIWYVETNVGYMVRFYSYDVAMFNVYASKLYNRRVQYEEEYARIKYSRTTTSHCGIFYSLFELLMTYPFTSWERMLDECAIRWMKKGKYETVSAKVWRTDRYQIKTTKEYTDHCEEAQDWRDNFDDDPDSITDIAQLMAD